MLGRADNKNAEFLGSLPETLNPTLLFIFVQVRVLFEMLVRKCGLQAVSAVTPEPHGKLITHIRKVYVMHDYEGILFYFRPIFHCLFDSSYR